MMDLAMEWGRLTGMDTVGLESFSTIGQIALPGKALLFHMTVNLYSSSIILVVSQIVHIEIWI